MKSNELNRRRFLGASAAAVLAPYVRTSRAAGSLSVGFWDHWVPGANEVLAKLCNEWAAKEKVDLKLDFITTQGNKLVLTVSMEALAKAGHDVITLTTSQAPAQRRHLEPVDDLVNPLIAKYGKPNSAVEYVGKQDGHWIALPAMTGNATFSASARIDVFKRYAGLDLTKMYPPGAPPNKAMTDQWTWNNFLLAAEQCHKAGVPAGIGFGVTGDSVNAVGAIFAAHGAQLIDAKGNITVDSDATRQALEYSRRLLQFLPPNVFAWNDASNNKWLISGRGSFIMNPPSAWAVAKRDNLKVAEQLWTFPVPKGPKGRYQSAVNFFWGIWKFSKNKAAARSLLSYLSERRAIDQLVNASNGFDVPPFLGLRDFKIWAETGPPKGTLYHYPPTEDQVVYVPGWPAPANFQSQIYAQATMPRMVARHVSRREPVERVISWAKSELESYARV